MLQLLLAIKYYDFGQLGDFNQAVADSYDPLMLIISDNVITWASASSLKALTRESSFSFSNAHWEKRQRERDF